MDKTPRPLLEHLGELRSCLIQSIMGVSASMVLCYFFVGHIMEALRRPMMLVMPKDARFVVLSPQEYFFTELKAALFFGIILGCPWIFWQIWRFVAPGLYKGERRLLFFFVISASSCFVGGCLFAYFLVLPPAFSYFLGILPPNVTGAYSIGMLYGFSITLLFAFGVVFQTPIIVFLLAILGFVSVESFAKYRRHVFVLCFVVGTLLTPPDPITQIMLALPAYALFEIGLLIARLLIKKRAVISSDAPSQ